MNPRSFSRRKFRDRNLNDERAERVNLGLAISAATMRPGQERTLPEIAAYCDCSKQLISQLEKRAIRKVRLALRLRYGIISTDRLP